MLEGKPWPKEQSAQRSDKHGKQAEEKQRGQGAGRGWETSFFPG